MQKFAEIFEICLISPPRKIYIPNYKLSLGVHRKLFDLGYICKNAENNCFDFISVYAETKKIASLWVESKYFKILGHLYDKMN